jgi:hypothetical protein
MLVSEGHWLGCLRMTLFDWQDFIDRGHGKEMAVAQVSHAIMSHIGANNEQVFIHHQYVLKSIHQHRISLETFELLPDIIAYGQVLEDRDRHLLFLFESRAGWLHLVIKRAEASRRIYVSTFHRTTKAKVAAKHRKFELIRE